MSRSTILAVFTLAAFGCSGAATTELGTSVSGGSGGFAEDAGIGVDSGAGGVAGGGGNEMPCVLVDTTPIVGSSCKGDADCETKSMCNPGACDIPTGTCAIHALPNGSPCENGGVCIDRRCCAKP